MQKMLKLEVEKKAPFSNPVIKIMFVIVIFMQANFECY